MCHSHTTHNPSENQAATCLANQTLKDRVEEHIGPHPASPVALPRGSCDKTRPSTHAISTHTISTHGCCPHCPCPVEEACGTGSQSRHRRASAGRAGARRSREGGGCGVATPRVCTLTRTDPAARGPYPQPSAPAAPLFPPTALPLPALDPKTPPGKGWPQGARGRTRCQYQAY